MTTISSIERITNVPGAYKTVLSRQAELHFRRNGQGVRIIKYLTPWLMAGMPPEQRKEEGMSLNRITAYLLAGLRNLGLPLPRVYKCGIDEDGFAFHETSFEGVDCQALVLSQPKKSQEIIGKILAASMGILEQTEPWQFGIDLKMDNFCFGTQGKVRFVDIYPPICRLPDRTYSIHYPNPSDEAALEKEVGRKLTLAGAVSRLHFFFVSLGNGTLEGEFLGEVKKLPRKLSEKIQERIKSSPANIAARLKGGELRKFIEELEIDEDAIRLIAARVIPANERKPEIMKRVFALSSIYGGSDQSDEPRELRFQKAKDLIIAELGL